VNLFGLFDRQSKHVRVVSVFLENPHSLHHADDVMQKAHVGSGFFYQWAADAEDKGWIRKGHDAPEEENKPSPVHYRLTELGQEILTAECDCDCGHDHAV
jgi:hypothetical protein